MNYWDVLGIEPTRNRSAIEEAYRKQLKFVSEANRQLLDSAYRQALQDSGHQSEDSPVAPATADTPPAEEARQEPAEAPEPLSARDEQVARETVIQIRALLNDSYRTRDVAVWRAILAEPPSDQPAVRRRIGEALEQEVRPLAENGAFPPEVTHFLGDWFGWESLVRLAPPPGHPEDIHDASGPFTAESGPEPEPDAGAGNFWPAVIGWIVGLIILTSLFSDMGGG